MEPRPNELSTGSEPSSVGPEGPTGTVPGPQPAGPEPAYQWSPPTPDDPAATLLGVPGLAFGRVLHRFVAWVVDWVVIGIATLVFAIVPLGLLNDPDAASAVTSIISVTVSFAYFVLFWTSRRHATPGMRLFNLQVGNAFDGRVLDRGQAVRRWIGLGIPLTLLGIVPALATAGSSIAFLWYLALWLSALLSPTKQGLHDRFAGSAVVGPAGGQGNALAVGCVLAIVLLFVLPILAFIGLLFLGGQISDILSDVGTSN